MKLQGKAPQQTIGSEQEYRALKQINFSALKCMAEDRWQFYKQYVLGEKKVLTPNPDIVRGSLVHEILAYGIDALENKFHIQTVSELEKTGAQINLVALKLWDKTLACTDEDGVQQRLFFDLFEEAFNEVKYDRNGKEVKYKKKEVAYAMEEFVGGEAEAWYKMKREANGKILVSMDDLQAAENIVERIKNCDYMQDLFPTDVERYQVLSELPATFHHNGLELKFMVDRTIIDHYEKRIYPKDFKCTYLVQEWAYKYIKDWYYLQGGVYKAGLMEWAKAEGMEDYEVAPMEFIACHSFNLLAPLRYQTTNEDWNAAMNGFTMRGREYPGVNSLISDILWSSDTQKWDIGRQDYIANGRKLMNIDYGK